MMDFEESKHSHSCKIRFVIQFASSISVGQGLLEVERTGYNSYAQKEIHVT